MPDSFNSSNRTSVTINNVALTPLEVQGERVVTLAMIDKVHGRPDGTARRNFNTNRDRMVEGKHFAKMSADEFRSRFPGIISARATEDLTLLTERGYLLLTKPFTDDLAWQVQDMLVESYFTKKAEPAPVRRTPRVDVSREHRLASQHYLKLAKMAGLSGNQALIASNRATVALTGIDTLGLMGITHMNAPQNENLLTPTDIGKKLGNLSARTVNQILCGMGLQMQGRDHKGHVYYEPTEAGKQAGGVMQDTDRKHSTGAPVRQLRWASSVADMIRADMDEDSAA